MANVTRVSRDLHVPAAKAYAGLADYRGVHDRILPRPPFGALRVVEGGRGAGTVIGVETKVLGGVRVLRMTVDEPEPGRVLRETATDGTVTRFLVEPTGPTSCRVTIETTWPDRQFLRDLLVGSLYRKELRNLAKALA